MQSQLPPPESNLISCTHQYSPQHPHSGQRERRTIAEKMKMIEYIKKHKLKNREAASLFRVSEGFIHNLLYNEERIKQVNESSTCWKDRKITDYRRPLEIIENQTVKWIDKCNQSSTGVSVSDIAIKLYAFNLKNELMKSLEHDSEIDDFQCSNGWIQRVLKRNNMHRVFHFGEERSVDIPLIKEQMQKIVTKIDKVDPSCLLNLDETALYFESIAPSSIQRLKDDRHSVKDSKKRITITIISARNGDRWPLQIINRTAKPRCFGNINVEEQYGIWYGHQPKAWQDSNTFSNLLKRLNQLALERGKQYFILLDNVSSHIKGAYDIGCTGTIDDELRFGNLVLIFLPVNSTSIAQPNDRGIICALKRRYRKYQLLSYLAYLTENNFNAEFTLTKFSHLPKALSWLNLSWGLMNKNTVINCFNSVLNRFRREESANVNQMEIDTHSYNPQYNEQGYLIEI